GALSGLLIAMASAGSSLFPLWIGFAGDRWGLRAGLFTLEGLLILLVLISRLLGRQLHSRPVGGRHGQGRSADGLNTRAPTHHRSSRARQSGPTGWPAGSSTPGSSQNPAKSPSAGRWRTKTRPPWRRSPKRSTRSCTGLRRPGAGIWAARPWTPAWQREATG